jgi:hypothetical protein
MQINMRKMKKTSLRQCGGFSSNRNAFEPFAPLANEPDVKSVYYDEKADHLIYTKGEISWWTHNIYSMNPTKQITIPEIDVYKVRVIK